jgi:hypothetical protein
MIQRPCVTQLSVTVTNTSDNQLIKKKEKVYSGPRSASPMVVGQHILWGSVWWTKTIHLMAGKQKVGGGGDQGPLSPSALSPVPKDVRSPGPTS